MPKIAKKGSYRETLPAGKYQWCSCGESKGDPYCDNSCEGAGYKPVEVEFKEETTVSWCGCKRSGKGPFCDGAHKSL